MQQLMELLVLLALILLGLSVLIRRSRRAGASPAPAILKISDPAVAHHALVENADDFSNRPLPPFLVALANSRGGQLGESMLSVRYGPHWRALRCNLTAETLHPSRLADLPPLQQDAIQALVAGLSAAGQGAIAVGGHLDAAVFRVVARLCFGDGVDDCHVRAMRCAIRGTQQVAAGGNTAVPGSMLAKLAEWSRHRRQFAYHGQMSKLVITAMAAR
jgi:cytochrome P450